MLQVIGSRNASCRFIVALDLRLVNFLLPSWQLSLASLPVRNNAVSIQYGKYTAQERCYFLDLGSNWT